MFSTKILTNTVRVEVEQKILEYYFRCNVLNVTFAGPKPGGWGNSVAVGAPSLILRAGDNSKFTNPSFDSSGQRVFPFLEAFIIYILLAVWSTDNVVMARNSRSHPPSAPPAEG